VLMCDACLSLLIAKLYRMQQKQVPGLAKKVAVVLQAGEAPEQCSSSARRVHICLNQP
jgi:hypothetical protein